MSENTPSYGISTKEVPPQQLIRHVKKKIWKYLIITILIGGYSFYFLKFKFLDYSSTATFYVNDNSIISSSTLELKALESISSSDNFNNIYQLVNSAPTQMHLIKKFNLLAHYGIDSTKEFYFQKAIAIVKSRIEVKKNPYNAISVTVRDPQRYFSAEMANEIVSYLEELNQNFYLNNIQKKIQISRAYVEQLEIDNAKKTIGIDSILKKINIMLSSGKLSDKSYFDLLLQQQKLNQVLNVFQTSAYDLINSQKLYNLSIQALNYKSFPTITLLQTAMPAFRSTAIMAMLFSSLIMVLVLMILILQAYLYLRYNDYIHYIFSGKESDK